MRTKVFPIVVLGFVLATPAVRAQWVSEGYELKAGWNAVWLSHDASHDSIENLFPTTVEEVWRWNPASSPSQFTQSPAAPLQPDTQWLVFKRNDPVNTTMTTLAPNAAYLVKVADATPTFTHQLTGRPVPPSYSWKSSGLNFFGFPTEEPDSAATRNFETFLSYTNAISAGSGIFKYNGGPIVSNPVQVNAPLFEPVSRGRAYWIKSSQFSDYYGPLRVSISGSGLAFGDTGSALSLKIRNVTEGSVDATLTPTTSASPPTGQTAIAGAVPLRLRGALNPTTGQFTYSDFTGATDFSLAAGEEIELVFAVDRSTMAGTPGDVFQSIVQLTDSLNINRIDLPVSAETTSPSGLWVGAAVITTVDQVTASPNEQPDGTALIDVTTDTDADAPSEFPLRLIVHRDDAGNVKLLQRVFIGEDTGGSVIVAGAESHLDASKLATARRLSSSTFPLGESFLGTGDLGLAPAAVSLSVTLGAGKSTNPFVHTFHPDHDELSEALTVTRDIDLTFAATAPTGISELGWGSTTLGGNYTETLSGLRAQDITIKGTFLLYRVSDIDTLTE